MKPLLLFASTYIAVFALGFQSLNVNQGRYGWAAVTSLAIGGSHILLYRYMPGAHVAEILAYLAGGVLGITSSMFFHRRAMAWWQRLIAWRPDWPGLLDRLDAYLEGAIGYHNAPDAPPRRNPIGPAWRGQCFAEKRCETQCNLCAAGNRSDTQ
jgi:hypothetical protein